MRVVFLGSAGSVPVRRHILTSLLVDNYLLDCGYGVPCELAELGLLHEVKAVFVSHFHLDHYYGLGELMWKYYLYGRESPLTVIGPRGVTEVVKSLLESARLPLAKLPFDVDFVELDPGDKYLNVKTSEVTHSVEPALAFRIEGRSIVVYSGDTAPSRSVVDLARGAYLLVHEASYPAGDEEKAHGDGHSTARDAGLVAREAQVKMLALVHIPYFRVKAENVAIQFASSASKVFGGPVIVPASGMTLLLP